MAVEKELPPAVLEGFGGLRTGFKSADHEGRTTQTAGKVRAGHLTKFMVPIMWKEAGGTADE